MLCGHFVLERGRWIFGTGSWNNLAYRKGGATLILSEEQAIQLSRFERDVVVTISRRSMDDVSLEVDKFSRWSAPGG
jgi:hypothetical protein